MTGRTTLVPGRGREHLKRTTVGRQALALAVALALWSCSTAASTPDPSEPVASPQHDAPDEPDTPGVTTSPNGDADVSEGDDPAGDGDADALPEDAEHVTVRAVGLGPYEGLPTALTAGVVTFVFEQQDPSTRRAHDFYIEELDAGTRIVPTDSTEQLTVELEPGTYTVYCTVSGHRQAGMEGQFEVVEDA